MDIQAKVGGLYDDWRLYLHDPQEAKRLIKAKRGAEILTLPRMQVVSGHWMTHSVILKREDDGRILLAPALVAMCPADRRLRRFLLPEHGAKRVLWDHHGTVEPVCYGMFPPRKMILLMGSVFWRHEADLRCRHYGTMLSLENLLDKCEEQE